MNEWPTKCPTCGAVLILNRYYSIGYCPGTCLDTCLIHNAPISSPNGVGPECPECRTIRVNRETQIENELMHVH